MDWETLKKIIALAAIAGIIIAAFVVLSSVWLGPGEVAVIYDPFSKSISGPFIGPTVFFKWPWQGVIKDFYTIDIIDMTSEPDADYRPISALTKDGVSITVEMSFTYALDPDKFIGLAKNYPRIDYESNNMVPSMRQIVRDVISKYTVEEVITMRDQIAKEIASAFKAKIESDPTLSAIVLHEVNLRAIDLPPRVKNAIEAKIAAYQEKLAAEYQREKELILANASAAKEILIAEGKAKALLIQSQALKQSLQLLLNATRDPEVVRIYVMYEQLSRLQNPIIIVGSGAQPLITIPQAFNSTKPSGK